MDRAIPFIRKSVEAKKPFFAVIWFHAPHGPVVAGPEYRAMYSQYGKKKQNYYGCITALDDQVGRLSAELKALGADQNTMLWFCSDNGPEGGQKGVGSTGGLRGRKRSLFSGGVGVPGFLHWPSQAEAGRVVDMPCSTLDYLPTIFDVAGAEMPDERPLDGISLLPMIREHLEKRSKAIPFRFHMPKPRLFGSPTIALIKGQHKFMSNFSAEGGEDLLFDIREDRGETRNVLDAHVDLAGEMKEETRAFVESARLSHSGADYKEAGYEPVGRWVPVTGDWPGQAPGE
jgi:arylsulfatase A-like enzyme